MGWSFRSVMTANNVNDNNVLSFLNSTGIIDGVTISAINYIVLKSKYNGWWPLCNAIYPVCGDGINQTYSFQHKFNLKDPRDLDAAFRLTFNGTWVDSSSGALPDGASSTFANTHLAPSSILSQDSMHISVYSGTEADGVYCDIGCQDTTGTTSGLFIRPKSSSVCRSEVSDGSQFGNSVSSSLGHFVATRTASNARVIYYNGSVNASDSRASLAPPPEELYLSAFHGSAGLGSNSIRQLRFVTIGSGLSLSNVTAMYNDIQQFQKILGRAV